MSYKQEKELLVREFEQWYRTRPISMAPLLKQLDALAAERTHLSAFERKGCIYKLAAQELDIKVFRHFPFFFELNAGQSRYCRPEEGLAGCMRGDMGADERYLQGVKLLGAHELARLPEEPRTFSLGLGLNAIVRQGIEPLKQQIQSVKSKAQARRRKDFCNVATTALEAVATLSDRFVHRAETMHAVEIDADIKRSLERMTGFTMIGESHSFYEALQRAILWRELMQAFEGARFTSFGRLDVLLSDYYSADIANGVLTREDAADMLRYFFEYDLLRSKGTSRIQFTLGAEPSEFTGLMLEVLAENECAGIDLALYAADDDPDEYLNAVRPLLTCGAILLNRLRLGSELELTSAGLQRADSHTILARAAISLPAVLLGTLKPAIVGNWEGLHIDSYDGDFFAAEDIYTQFLDNLAAIERETVALLVNQADQRLQRCPMPLHSLSIANCAERARDITEYGALTTTISIELEGVGTFVRAFNAIRRLVYTQRRLPLSRFITAILNGFDGDAPLRRLAAESDQREDEMIFAMLVDDINEMFGTSREYDGVEVRPTLFARPASGLNSLATPDGRLANTLFTADLMPMSDCEHSDPQASDPIEQLGEMEAAALESNPPMEVPPDAEPKREDILSAYLDVSATATEMLAMPESFDDIIIEDEAPTPEYTSRNVTPLNYEVERPRIVLGKLLGNLCTLGKLPADADELRAVLARFADSVCAALEFRP